jgi:hypothetical protein
MACHRSEHGPMANRDLNIKFQEQTTLQNNFFQEFLNQLIK